ncbi:MULTISPECIES: tellurite resistance TerB family protein [Paracoccus]|uniref:2-dehydro-3-deoxyphosphooctonate aldolase n=1 Tax=Paracoccus litorisediminis TaxID=2006130 RepID=A0A844HII4_9RHOB|nr:MULTISPECIES: tellurite resistance TerB family protein [Paracoccus]MBD9527862.1 tellurite resistance TerB family protein [Paracoccus sp. PAR01]MTH59973.1 2-dehydro-3-deoxyphosphooctonate aldolase [Paracoccus litorisediminis]
MSETLPSFSPCDALVAVMVGVSASDQNLRTAELVAIERAVNHTPVFANYDIDRIRAVSQTVMSLFEEEDGLDALFGLVRASLPEKMFDTAYLLACDVAASDGRLGEVEAEMLAEIRHQLDISRLHAAAIELATSARHRVL